MFCEKCGKKLPDNSKFCPRCGEKINPSPIFGNKPLMLKKYGYNSGTFGFTVFQIFLFLILIVADIFILCFSNSWFIPSDKRTLLIIIFGFALIVNIVLIITKIANASAIHKTFLCITEEGINGVGGTPSYISNENVRIRYQDITMVNAKSGLVIVSTMERSYKFLVENNDIATGEILYHLERIQKEGK